MGNSCLYVKATFSSPFPPRTKATRVTVVVLSRCHETSSAIRQLPLTDRTLGIQTEFFSLAIQMKGIIPESSQACKTVLILLSDTT